jgi:mannose-6-phosphate isomerase-like protein (cupin superfamily)
MVRRRIPQAANRAARGLVLRRRRIRQVAGVHHASLPGGPRDTISGSSRSPRRSVFAGNRERIVEENEVNVRRVVTGHGRDGKSIVVSDVKVEPITASLVPGAEFHRLWGGDTAPTFPDSGAMPSYSTYFPPVNGFRFWFFSLPPGSRAASEAPAATLTDPSAALSEFEAKLPGLGQYLEPDVPGMHTTPTVDFEVVVSGEVVLELDDSASVTLKAGDTVVQNGTRHRWHNHGAVPAVIAVFICGAHHARFPTR